MTDRDPYTCDLFGDLIIPDNLAGLCYSFVPDLTKGITICLTGYFDCARGNIKRVKAMQSKLNRFSIDVTENWRNDIDILAVGDRAKFVSLKIKNAIKLGIPIVKEYDLLENINFYR
jgi:NAD-dependent DNA ligase